MTRSKTKLAQSAKKIHRQAEEKKIEAKKEVMDDEQVNKSYDANVLSQLPDIDMKKKGVAPNRVSDKSKPVKRTIEELIKENEELRQQNKQLQTIILQNKYKSAGEGKAKLAESEEKKDSIMKGK